MKKFLFVLLVGSLLLSSCSKYDETSSLDGYDFSISPIESETPSEDISEETSDSSSEEENTMFDYSSLTKEELSQYITLGEYKGLESEKYIVEVKDEDIELYIENVLISQSELVEVSDRAAKEGDVLTIDYTGYIDGETFERGSATNASLTIGDKNFIEGFEEGLIGAKKGDKVSLNLKFPDDDYYENLAGKAVVFEVTVHKIEATVLPELTDSFVEEYTDGEIKTVALFKEDVYNKILEATKTDKLKESKDKYWTKVLENSTVIKFPDGVIDEYVQSCEDYYSQYAAIYGISLKDFLEKFLETSVEEFRESRKIDAEQSHKTQMVLYAAIYAENFEKNISDEDYQAWLNDFATSIGASVEQIVEQYSKDSLKNTCLFDLFLNHIYEYRTEVDPETSADSSEATSADTSTDESNTSTSEEIEDTSSNASDKNAIDFQAKNLIN